MAYFTSDNLNNVLDIFGKIQDQTNPIQPRTPNILTTPVTSIRPREYVQVGGIGATLSQNMPLLLGGGALLYLITRPTRRTRR